MVEDFQWRIVASKMLEVLMSGLLQPSGAFRSSLDPSRFVASRPLDDEALGDSSPHFLDFDLTQDRAGSALLTR
ncbi:MAG: hypothetical protein NWR99_10745, partial [Verrucomicrobiales bacterium]|nr:hypothetical protein [Verrucomicrobiales bacterium]